jgi:hypothetical protein
MPIVAAAAVIGVKLLSVDAACVDVEACSSDEELGQEGGITGKYGFTESFA